MYQIQMYLICNNEVERPCGMPHLHAVASGKGASQREVKRW